MTSIELRLYQNDDPTRMQVRQFDLPEPGGSVSIGRGDENGAWIAQVVVLPAETAADYDKETT